MLPKMPNYMRPKTPKVAPSSKSNTLNDNKTSEKKHP